MTEDRMCLGYIAAMAAARTFNAAREAYIASSSNLYFARAALDAARAALDAARADMLASAGLTRSERVDLEDALDHALADAILRSEDEALARALESAELEDAARAALNEVVFPEGDDNG